jgi:hypothetical protein
MIRALTVDRFMIKKERMQVKSHYKKAQGGNTSECSKQVWCGVMKYS